MLLLGLAWVVSTCVPASVHVPLTTVHRPAVDMRQFTGLHFPGFSLNDIEVRHLFNDELVRSLRQAFRARGYSVDSDIPLIFPPEQIPTVSFERRSALVVSGILALSPYTYTGIKADTREVFDAVGRRHTTATRQYVEDTGWVLKGWIVLIDHGQPFLRLGPINAETRQRRVFGPIPLATAADIFAWTEIAPYLVYAIEPTRIPTTRTLLR